MSCDDRFFRYYSLISFLEALAYYNDGRIMSIELHTKHDDGRKETFLGVWNYKFLLE